jgi:hypothetical protein
VRRKRSTSGLWRYLQKKHFVASRRVHTTAVWIIVFRNGLDGQRRAMPLPSLMIVVAT